MDISPHPITAKTDTPRGFEKDWNVDDSLDHVNLRLRTLPGWREIIAENGQAFACLKVKRVIQNDCFPVKTGA